MRFRDWWSHVPASLKIVLGSFLIHFVRLDFGWHGSGFFFDVLRREVFNQRSPLSDAMVGSWTGLSHRFIKEVPSGAEEIIAAALVAAALILQLLTASFWMLFMRISGRKKRIGVLLVAAVLASPVIMTVYGGVAPICLRLTEPLLVAERLVPEILEWETACLLPEYEIAPFIEMPPNGTVAEAGELWLERRSDREPFLLTMPGCRLNRIGVNSRDIPPFVSLCSRRRPAALSELAEPRTPAAVVSRSCARPIPISPAYSDFNNNFQAVVSDNGEWLAWIDPDVTPGHKRIYLERFATGERIEVPLTSLGSARLDLLGVSYQSSEMLVSTDRSKVVCIGFDGSVVGETKDLTDLGYDNGTILGSTLFPPGGWITWQSLPSPTELLWQLSGGPGKHRVSEGNRIDSAAVNPDAGLISVGVSGDRDGGNREAAAYVLRVSDGRELFRKYFPRRAWIQVATVGDKWFAYSSSQHECGMGSPDCRVVSIPSAGR